MHFTDSQLPFSQPSQQCINGHSSASILPTEQGGSICLFCLRTLLTSPKPITLHLSFALSQLSQALSQPQFLHNLLTFHPHFLVSPIVYAVSNAEDEEVARLVMEVVGKLCDAGGEFIVGEFVERVSERISCGALGWSRRQAYVLHCFGVLLNYAEINPYVHIKDKNALVSNLVAGLEMPSEEIQGEVLFILYRLSLYQYHRDDGGTDIFTTFCPKLWRLSLEALMKYENDDVRTNCVALVQRGIFQVANGNNIHFVNPYEADNFSQATEDEIDGFHLSILFAEAIKGPLLSSDKQVQISTLNLLFHYLSREGTQRKQVEDLVEENVADYVFEALRLSESTDPLVSSCMLVLDLLSETEQAFKQRLAVGFTTLVKALHYVADIPFHPVQCQTLKLILKCVSDCPGIVSTSQVDELVLVLTKMLKMQNNAGIEMLPDTFILACLLYVALMRYLPSGISNIAVSLRDATKHAGLTCLNDTRNSSQLLHSLHFIKEAYSYSCEEHLIAESSTKELRNCIVDTCKDNILPWFVESFSDVEEEEIVLGVLETFHSIMLQYDDINVMKFAEALASYSWFSLSFGCLGIYPAERMKWRVYLMLSSLLDILLGENSGQPIRDAVSYLPIDPNDLLFIMGQKTSNSLEMSSSQSAVLLLLYASSLFNDRVADEKVVLASLEQYILVNRRDLLYGDSDSSTITQLGSVYGLYRALAKMSYQIPYSSEAENIFFRLMTAREYDLSSARIHLASLKWFFQQEKLIKALSHQILKFCRTISSNGIYIPVQGENSHCISVLAVGELVAAEDNYGAKILVCLFRDLLEEEGLENDITLVINLMTMITKAFPVASHQLNVHGIIDAIRSLYDFSSHYSFSNISMAVLLLLYNILYSLSPETLCDVDACRDVTTKLIDYLIPAVTAESWTYESLLLVGVLSLILKDSSAEALAEFSKGILLHTSLISAIDSTIRFACSQGPALFDHDEDTSTGATLMFILLLYYFSLESLRAVLPEAVNWQTFLGSSSSKDQISFISISCQDLCRLMHYGSPPVKLAASYCLLQIFTGISEQRTKAHELTQAAGCLKSVVSVLEGLVFYADSRVALNCCLCLSIILGWEEVGFLERKVVRRNTWCQFIVEELALSLAAPCVASKSFISLYKPAVHIAVALLKLQKVPVWMKSVFDSSIFGIIRNLEANDVSTEIVLLFRELLKSQFLEADQVTSLNRLLQVCRKKLYTENAQTDSRDDTVEETNVQDDLGEMCRHLIHLMVSDAAAGESALQNGSMRLLEEIEMFFRALGIEDDI